MNTTMSRLLPTVTNMIRVDHTHVLSTFHQYRAITRFISRCSSSLSLRMSSSATDRTAG